MEKFNPVQPITDTQDSILNLSPGRKLLIVDDDENLCTQMKWALAQDYEIFLAYDRQSALEIFGREQPPVVTLDLGLMPDPNGVGEGFLALSEMLNQDVLTKVVLITGHTEKEHALKGISLGAYDFLCKPIQMDELRVILKRAFYVKHLEQEHRLHEQSVGGESFEGMVGKSPEMQKIYEAIRKVATTDVSVLIVGESGAGKELVARAIHQQSARKDNPFVAINCGAIPENLLETELFGHEKGAFTGAHIQRKGRIESAQGGTLFLDEIGELSPPLQVKLLRFLQEHRIERVGGRQEIAVDTRTIAAMNSDPRQAIKQGRFREDLYYRLGVVTIPLPPLRERGEDIQLMAKVLVHRYSGESGKRLTGFTRQAINALRTYSWPGNVRELENRIRRAVIMAGGPRLTSADLELASSDATYESGQLKQVLEDMKKDLVRGALSRNEGNITRSAKELGVSRPTLYELMKRLNCEGS